MCFCSFWRWFMEKQASKLPSLTSPSSVTTGYYLWAFALATLLHCIVDIECWNYSFRLTIDKLEVAKRICPKIKKLDISMFNFSFDDQDEATAAELSKSSAMYFEFEVGLRFWERRCLADIALQELRDLEVQYLDDSKTFRTSIESMSANLTRICLNKMMSISFETLSAIKINCGYGFLVFSSSPNLFLCLRCLNTLEVYVDNIFVVNRQMTLDQAAQEAFNPPWPSLKSLKLGGMVRIASVWKQFWYHHSPDDNWICAEVPPWRLFEH